MRAAKCAQWQCAVLWWHAALQCCCSAVALQKTRQEVGCFRFGMVRSNCISQSCLSAHTTNIGIWHVAIMLGNSIGSLHVSLGGVEVKSLRDLAVVEMVPIEQDQGLVSRVAHSRVNCVIEWHWIDRALFQFLSK